MGVRWSRMSWSEKNELWKRWRRGETLRDIAHGLRRAPSVVYAAVGAEGGIAPRPRRRSRIALTTTEQEEISRQLAQGQSLRTISRILRRAPSTISREVARNSCAPGFPWTLDCERVLAGGVSKWGSQIKVRRRRREPGGRPEMLPGTAVGDGFRPGASARRCCVCCAARILSPCRGSWGSRRRGPRSGGISFWPQARPA